MHTEVIIAVHESTRCLVKNWFTAGVSFLEMA